MSTMLTAVISSVTGTIFGVIGFGVVKSFITAQDQSAWSAAEISIIVSAVPIGLALGAFVIAFMSLTVIGKRAGG